MRVDLVEFSTCRILSLEAEAVSNGCKRGNRLRYLAGTMLLQRGWQFTAVGQTAFSSCKEEYACQVKELFT